MPRINNNDRKTIIANMLQKTSFKSQIETEKKRIGKELYKSTQAWLKKKHGKEIMNYINGMPPQFRRVMCKEIRNITTEQITSYRFQKDAKTAAPALMKTVIEDKRQLNLWASELLRLVGINNGRLIFVLPKSLWTPSHFDDPWLQDLSGEESPLQALNAIVSDARNLLNEMECFLRFVRTPRRLSELMPEAVPFLPQRTQSIAVIPDPSSALAELMKAGFVATQETSNANS